MMKFCIFLAFILWCSVVNGQSVIVLDKNNYQQQLNAHNIVLVKFYAPWCGHCKKIAPEYEKAASMLLSKSSPVALAEVDCTVEESICSENQVSGYPTLKIFKDGKFDSDYKGERDADGIMNYMLLRSRPASIEFNSLSDLTNILSDEKPTVILYSKSDDEFLKQYLNMASKLIDYVVLAHTHNPVFESPENIAIRMYLPKKLFSKLEDDFNVYNGQMNVAALESWIQSNGHGIVGYRTNNNGFFFPDSNLVVIYNNYTLEGYLSGVTYVRNRILKAVKTNKDKFKSLNFVYSPSEEFRSEMGEYGFDYGVSLPVVRILSKDGKKYKLEKYSTDNLVKFVNDFLSGSLQPYIKSEPIKVGDTGAVKHIVALQFDSIVNDPTKDVMIVFHATWCGHCKTLMPKYEQAAELLKDEPNLVLVAMNAVDNDVPKHFEVTGFPTIYFISKSKKSQPIIYNGGREMNDIIQYLAKSSTEELVTYDRLGNKKKSDL